MVIDQHLYENWFQQENLAVTYFMLTDKYRYSNRELHHRFGMKYLEHLQKMEQLFFALHQQIPFFENYMNSNLENALEYQRLLSSNYLLLSNKFKFTHPPMHIDFYCKFLRHVELLEKYFLTLHKSEPIDESYTSKDPWKMWQYYGKLASTSMKLAMKYEYIDVKTHAYYEKLYLQSLKIMEENFLIEK
ncbi:hypothetical protein [Aquibacillus albus]|uniref:Uncharacterized protein n=1 Tax=Aquibacillus albus TaxID=1168171 RepID=A0ABS2N6H3_9BACI|nr:hypothetical protein [Aquibacillus albus]MBM7573706.1 hypothetical protein [Aquibacillus albus]